MEWKTIDSAPYHKRILCLLQHDETGLTQENELYRVIEDDVAYRTADDLTEISYRWNVVGWRDVITMKTLNDYRDECHLSSVDAGWWLDYDKHTIPAKMCLIHSEISEAMEGYRKCLPDDHLPHRPMVEVELADALIRIFDMAGKLNCDLEGAYNEKREYNKNRADHKLENRAKAGGKAF